VAVACTANAVAMAIAARSVATDLRSTVMGVVSAGGSVGALIAAPLGQAISQGYGWRAGLLAFTALALLMVPGACFTGRVDRLPPQPVNRADEQGAGAVVRLAMTRPAFLVMTLAYFVCGMQLVFLTTHLPSYLEICGLDPMLSAQALGMIGGFNVLGSLFFGWAGGHWPKLVLLGLIYSLRSLVLAWYFMAVPTPAGTLVFAGIMGFLWLGVAPLVQGWIADTVGLRWQAMLGGVAFVFHQLGSFVGAFGGGLIYDASGSYTRAWQIGVALGLAAGLVQAGFAWLRRDRGGPPTAVSPA
jgi:predicted MFS family arabinose efflux permease